MDDTYTIKPDIDVSASANRQAGVGAGKGLSTHYKLEAYDPQGNLKWVEEFDNLVEGKASGKSLRQQLRVDGIPMIEVMPAGDKVARANAVTRYFEAGMVYFVGREEGGVGEVLLDECEDQLLTFPRGTHDDLVDATVYGIMRLVGLADVMGETETIVVDDRVEISPV